MIDSPTGPLDLDTVVDGYMRYSRRLQSKDRARTRVRDDPDELAFDALHRAIDHQPDAAAVWEVVLEVLRRAPDEEAGLYAAGPLEDLVRARGAELIDRIEAEARRDEFFRWALGRIWLRRGGLPDDVLERVVRASGGAINPLPRSAS